MRKLFFLYFHVAFLKVKINGKFMLASLKTLIYSSLLSRFSSLPLTDFRLCFSAIGQFSPTYYSCMASGTIFRIRGGFRKHYQGQIAALCRGLLTGFSKWEGNFIWEGTPLILITPSTGLQILKIISTHKISTDLICYTFKRYSSRDTFSLQLT